MNPTDQREADVVAAGAVLWRPAAGVSADAPRRSSDVEIALVHRPRYDDWSLPKGKVHRGESHPVAAIREIGEETGFASVLGPRLGDTRYPVPEGDKVVHYWSARAGIGQFEPNKEVDELRWVAPDSAGPLLTYHYDRDLVGRFSTQFPPPAPLLLVRHAKAGDRRKWHGDDDLRPLTGKGRRQAAHLDQLLGCFGPTRAYAAPPVRCAQTIQPLADRLGLRIEPEPLLSEDGYWEDPAAGLARLLELVDQPGIPVICSQGGVIPDLVSELVGLLDAPSSKASTWVLGFAEAKVVTADYYPQPAD
jgi:8-oxo-dGTP diphosphatase